MSRHYRTCYGILFMTVLTATTAAPSLAMPGQHSLASGTTPIVNGRAQRVQVASLQTNSLSRLLDSCASLTSSSPASEDFISTLSQDEMKLSDLTQTASDSTIQRDPIPWEKHPCYNDNLSKEEQGQDWMAVGTAVPAYPGSRLPAQCDLDSAQHFYWKSDKGIIVFSNGAVARPDTASYPSMKK